MNGTTGITKQKAARYAVQLDRHEAKYIIPPQLVPEIKDFIKPFCSPDPYGKGKPPHYTITTMQLDTHNLALHYAKENEALARFKLRVRAYNTPGSSPVFLEIKQKIRGTIAKSRTSIPFEQWGEHLFKDKIIKLDFKSLKEETGFMEFRRLVNELDAQPVILIRYERESFFGTIDHYARVTFDSKLEYQPTNDWNNWGQNGHWRPIDSPLEQNKFFPFSGIVLELKTLSEVPQWMIDLVMNFNLERTGNCKYSTAMWKEAFFNGNIKMPNYASELLIW